MNDDEDDSMVAHRLRFCPKCGYETKDPGRLHRESILKGSCHLCGYPYVTKDSFGRVLRHALGLDDKQEEGRDSKWNNFVNECKKQRQALEDGGTLDTAIRPDLMAQGYTVMTFATLALVTLVAIWGWLRQIYFLVLALASFLFIAGAIWRNRWLSRHNITMTADGIRFSGGGEQKTIAWRDVYKTRVFLFESPSSQAFIPGVFSVHIIPTLHRNDPMLTAMGAGIREPDDENRIEVGQEYCGVAMVAWLVRELTDREPEIVQIDKTAGA